jgi:hypothetical protein
MCQILVQQDLTFIYTYIYIILYTLYIYYIYIYITYILYIYTYVHHFVQDLDPWIHEQNCDFRMRRSPVPKRICTSFFTMFSYSQWPHNGLTNDKTACFFQSFHLSDNPRQFSSKAGATSSCWRRSQVEAPAEVVKVKEHPGNTSCIGFMDVTDWV